MPVEGVRARKCPVNSVKRQPLRNNRVSIDIIIVVKVDKLVIEGLPKDDQDCENKKCRDGKILPTPCNLSGFARSRALGGVPGAGTLSRCHSDLQQILPLQSRMDRKLSINP